MAEIIARKWLVAAQAALDDVCHWSRGFNRVFAAVHNGDSALPTGCLRRIPRIDIVPVGWSDSRDLHEYVLGAVRAK